MSKNTYFHPQVSGSEVDLSGVEILLHHQYHHEMFSDHHLVAVDAPLSESAASLLNQDLGDLNGVPASVANASQTKQTVKKDRHSKIFTAQGPRDRRVRLSIDIARKFFDLQDILGFDKPSKTLDWLLTKSSAAIKELVQTKQTGSGSSPSECDEVLSSEGNGDPVENGNSSGANSQWKSANILVKGSKDTQQQAAASYHAKESRAKARARAKERTREKMCIKQLDGAGSNLNPSIPIQYGDNKFEDFQLSAGSSSNHMSCTFNANAGLCEPIPNCALSHEGASDDLIQESIVIQRKSRNPSFWGIHQNLIFSKDANSSYSFPSDINAAENWDISSFTSQSNLCAIWDQHKFNNRPSNQ